MVDNNDTYNTNAQYNNLVLEDSIADSSLTKDEKIRMIESHYMIPNNYLGLKVSLYYDLVEKYHQIQLKMGAVWDKHAGKKQKIAVCEEIIQEFACLVNVMKNTSIENDEIRRKFDSARDVLFKYMPWLDIPAEPAITGNIYCKSDDLSKQVIAKNKNTAAVMLNTKNSNVKYIGPSS